MNKKKLDADTFTGAMNRLDERFIEEAAERDVVPAAGRGTRPVRWILPLAATLGILIVAIPIGAHVAMGGMRASKANEAIGHDTMPLESSIEAAEQYQASEKGNTYYGDSVSDTGITAVNLKETTADTMTFILTKAAGAAMLSLSSDDPKMVCQSVEADGVACENGKLPAAAGTYTVRITFTGMEKDRITVHVSGSRFSFVWDRNP